MKMKCLIADFMHESISELLIKIGVDPIYKPRITRSEILDSIQGYEGLLIRSKTKVDAELIANASKLRFVGRAGAGIDNLDEEALEKAAIKILNAPEGNRNAVGEHAMALLLGLLNHIYKSDQEVRNYTWDREGNRGTELATKTVGLVGYGNMGQSFARKLSGFGCKIVAYDKYKDNYSDSIVVESTMEQLFEETDIFSLHVPLTSETLGMVDYEFLRRFKKPIYFLNTARGEIVKLDALARALKENKIIGAGLDVLENEKLTQLTDKQKESFEYLTKSEKTILTPHVAGWSVESYQMINTVLVGKIESFIKGEI